MRRERVPAHAYLHAGMNAGIAANLSELAEICPSARQRDKKYRRFGSWGLVPTSRSSPHSMSRSRRIYCVAATTDRSPNDLAGVTRSTVRSRPHVKVGLPPQSLPYCARQGFHPRASGPISRNPHRRTGRLFLHADSLRSIPSPVGAKRRKEFSCSATRSARRNSCLQQLKLEVRTGNALPCAAPKSTSTW